LILLFEFGIARAQFIQIAHRAKQVADAAKHAGGGPLDRA
jgi:hypothetical protein